MFVFDPGFAICLIKLCQGDNREVWKFAGKGCGVKNVFLCIN